MAGYLKAVAVVVAVLGVLMGGLFVVAVMTDEPYFKAAMARERNKGNVFFETEYRMARAQHIFVIYSAVGCFTTALVGGSLLWGLGLAHSKLDRMGR